MFRSVQCEHGEPKVTVGDSLAHTGFCEEQLCVLQCPDAQLQTIK